MKKFDRWLSILMCICMLCTSMPADIAPAFAEGELEAAVVEIDELTSDEETEPELMLGDAEPSAEVQFEEATGEEAENPAAFTFGYAKVAQDTALSADIAGETLLAAISVGSIVLATERITEEDIDRMKVAFVYEGAAEEGWVDAAALVALSEEEILAFQSEITEAICYQDDVNYPLPEPVLVLPAESAEPEAEATEAPAESEEIVEPESVETPASSSAIKQEDESIVPEYEDTENVVMMQTNLYAETTPDDADISSENADVTMSFVTEAAELFVGDTLAIKPEFSDGKSRAVSYTLTQSGVVSLDIEAGTLTAMAPGSVTVQAKCAELNNASASIAITISENTGAEPRNTEEKDKIAISINPSTLYMIVGESQQISCDIPGNTEGTLVYSYSNENVISAVENGSVTALAEGECMITAALMQGEVSVAEAQCVVKVYAVDTLAASIAAELEVGQTADVAVEIPNELRSRVEYASSANGVATIDAFGKVTAVAPGKAVITLTLGKLTSELPVEVYAQATDFELSVDKSIMNIGDSAQLSAAYPEYTRGTVSYASLNPLVVAVDAETGLVMTVGPGKAELTATMGDVTKSVTVEVYGTPTSLELTLGEDVLPVGYHTQASVPLSEYIIAEITYSSSDTSIASVDENGVVTAVSVGYCDIIAEADSGIKTSVTFRVVDSAIGLAPKYHEMAVGQTLSLSYTISDESLAAAAAVFGSSDASVATVDPTTGLVTAVSDGEAIITVTLGDTGVTAKCYVTVHKAPTKLSITDAVKTIGVKQITDAIGYALYADDEPTIGAVKFKSSNTKVVQVNAKGQMKGIKAGTATITVTAYNDVSASFKVTVKKAPSKLTIKPTSASLAVGQSMKLSYTLTKNSAASVTFASSDTSVATVDASGKVTGVGVGSAKIKVSTHNGLNKYASITVNMAPENVMLSLSKTAVGVGMTAMAVGAVDTSSSAAFSYEYWTDKPEIISVDEFTGEIKALSIGSANVFVRTYNGVTSHVEGEERVETSAQINVVPAPDEVSIDGKEFNVIVGKVIKLPVLMTMEDGSTDCMTTYSLSTSNKKIAAVNAAGQVKGVKAGKATITLTAGNGDTATCTVVVMNSPKKVVLSKSSLTIGEEMSASLSAKVYYTSAKYYTHTAEDALGMGKFSSSDPTVVEVDAATGEISAVAPGKAKVSYKTLNGKTANCTVTVLARPSEIDMNVDSLKLGAGMSETVEAVYKEGELGDVTFSSSNPEITVVHAASGKVTAVAEGIATITIDAGNGVTNTCEVNVVPAPDEVSIDGKEFNVIVGKVIKLPVLMTMEDGSTDCMTTYSLSTSNKKIAAVNAAGQVKGVKAGKATITLTAGNGDTATCTVVVMNSPKKVVLSKSSLTIGEEMSASLSAKVYYTSTKYYTHTAEDALGMGKFSSSDPTVVEVDAATGEISAVAPGKAKVSYTTLNGKTANCTVTVLARPSEIDMNVDSLKLGAGMSETVEAVYKEGELGDVAFSSSNPEIAVVHAASGKVTAVAEGIATITIDAGNGVTNTCEVNVVPAPDEVSIDGKEFNVIVGKVIKLPVLMTMEDGSTDCMTTYSLSTSNKKIAAVNAAGQVKGVKAGKATITLTAGNGDTATCTVVVMNSPKKVVLNKKSLTLGVGMTSDIAARVYYTSSKYYTHTYEDVLGMGKFSSTNTDVVQIDAATGVMTAIGQGTATIGYKTLNGKTATCRVIVNDAPTSLNLTSTEVKLGEGMTYALGVTFNEYEYGPLTFASSNPEIAAVSDSGVITGMSYGEAVITVSSLNDVSAVCIVKVSHGPDKVGLNITSSNMAVKGKITLEPTATYLGSADDCVTAFSYKSSNTKVATVTSEGVVKGVKTGSATIRVTAANGKYADCKIVVRKAPTKVAFEKSLAYVGVGQSIMVDAKISFSGGSCIYQPGDTSYAKLTIDDSSIARIDPETGEIVGLEVGRTYLRLKTYNGKTAKCGIVVAPGAEWISFDNAIMILSRGETQTLTCSQSVGSMTSIAYSSSDSGIVSVSGSGSTCKITAVKQGTATITATSSNGKTSTCQVTVMAKPESIAFESNSIVIGLNENAALPEVIVTSSEGECSQAVAYSVTGDAVAVSAPGYVTGVKFGSAVVTAKTSNGLTATCKVTVQPEPTEMSLTAASSSIAVGDTAQLTLKMNAVGSYTYSVDDSSVLQVSARGVVTALKPGIATITATAYNGCNASCTLKVLAVPEWIKVDSDTATIGAGSMHQLNAFIEENTLGKVAYASSNEKAATVDANGKITAVAPGTAEIRAYVVGHETVFDTCVVTVLEKPTKIVLSERKITLRKGVAAQLDVAFACESGADCCGTAKYESSNPGVASVDQNGVISANAAGEAVITVALASDESISATCKVIVSATSVGFDVSMLSMSIGESYALRVDLPEGEDGFSLTSSHRNIVAVDSDTRVITAVGVGTATITAVNGKDVATCTVQVTRKPSYISIDERKARIVVGETFSLNVKPQPEGTAALLTYTSSDENVAVVSDSGIVTAVGYGSAVISVSNYDGTLKTQCEIETICEPEMIRFGELDDIVVAVGDSYVLEAPVMYNPNGECESTYTLAISNSGCAALSIVDGSYVIRAMSEGEATLRLKTANGKTATHKVIVVEAPKSMAFDSPIIYAAQGETIVPTVIGSNGAAMAVTFTSNNGCVSVNADGSLRAVFEGTATVTAISDSYPGLTAVAKVQVMKVPTSLSLSSASMTLAVGERDQLTPKFNSGAASASVEYASSDERIVRVGKDGSVIAVKEGIAIVSATAFGGKTAACAVTVKAAPTALTVQPAGISACVMDKVPLTAVFGSVDEYANLTYESADESIAIIDESGVVTFRSIGKTAIYVSTFNGLTAEVPVVVSETPSSVSFVPGTAAILAGDSAKLNIAFDKGAAYFTLSSSNPNVVSVAGDGTVHALKAGTATISLEMPSLNMSAKCELTVVDKLNGIVLTADTTTLQLHETTQLRCALAPANAIGTGLVTYTSSDSSVAEVDRRTGVVTGVAYGTAVITATAADGCTAQCEINVLGGKRRMLVAYYFGEPGDSGYLSFAYNNGYSMSSAFAASTVEGQKYDIKGPMSNAPKAELFGAIKSHFADATEDDVSVIYICAHGSGSYGPAGEYAFALDSSHYVTASELMTALEKIKGRVVLIMDSCHSGGVIDCNKSRLDAQGGRISVIASSHRITNSCYWYASEKFTSVDFYTHALLQGIGFNEANGIGGARGWTIGYEPADTAGNNDGQVDLTELFSYAKSVTMANVKKYQGHSQFRGNPAQTPQSYIGSMNEDLVMFAW